MQDIILEARESESPDVVLLIAENPEAQRLIVSWKSLPRSIKQAELEPDTIQEVWDLIEFSVDKWAKIAHVHSGLAKDLAEMLIENNLIYPDGTLNQYVQKFLNSQVIAKIAKPKAKK